MSPTQRTLAWLKRHGYHVWTVERWIPRAQKRIDLFGIIDLLCIHQRKLVGFQSCGLAHSEHRKKILESPNTPLWLQTGNGLRLISWRQTAVKAPRTRQKALKGFYRPTKAKRRLWTPRLVDFTLSPEGTVEAIEY